MTLTPSPPDPSTPADMPDTGIIRLSGHGSTVMAMDLRTQLVAAAESSAATVIDASELLSVGQAVLQLLIAARHEATARTQNLSYIGASTAFSERVASCQLAHAIGLETAKDISQ